MQPDLTVVVSKLVLFIGVAKTASAGLQAALADIKASFEDGLSPMYYQHISFLPFIIAAGSQMRFGMIHRCDKVMPSCMLCTPKSASLATWLMPS